MDKQQSTDAIVQKLREKFIIECEENGERYHEVDVRRVRTDDWQIERFVITHDTEDKAYEALVRALQWKKSFGVHERTDQYFPKEYYEWTETHAYGRDKDNRLIQWEKYKTEHKISELNLLSKQFIAHIMEKIDSAEPRKGFTVVSDVNGAGMSNINMEIFKFKIEINKHYPGGMKSNLVLDMPSILSGVAKIILSLCDQKLKDNIHFVKSKDLYKYIDPQIIPIELSGKRVSKGVKPEGLQSMKELSSKLGLTEKVIKSYYKNFGKGFDD